MLVITYLMYLVTLSACSVCGSVVLPINASVSSELVKWQEPLRNPFDYTLPRQNLRSGGEKLTPLKLSLQRTARLTNWQITDLVLVGTVARAGVFQGLVRDPRKMIHVISAGDIVTKARLQVSEVSADAISLLSLPKALNAPDVPIVSTETAAPKKYAELTETSENFAARRMAFSSPALDTISLDESLNSQSFPQSFPQSIPQSTPQLNPQSGTGKRAVFSLQLRPDRVSSRSIVDERK